LLVGPITRLALRLARGDERRDFISGERYWYTITFGSAAVAAIAFSPLGLVAACTGGAVTFIAVTGLFIFGGHLLKRERTSPNRNQVLAAAKQRSDRLSPHDEEDIRTLLDAGFPKEAMDRVMRVDGQDGHG
jgi:hypothetical protein